jgi:23S rRNA pseudouridine1911/1915/1917 synthase
MEPKVVYQDDSLFIIDKPAGWIVNEAETTKGQKVIQEWLDQFDYPLSGNREFRSGIVHRLDKETSGILLVAKTKEAFEKLQSEFKNREVKKTYAALLHGHIVPEEGEITANVGRLPWRRDRFGVLPGGRESETRYKVYKYYDELPIRHDKNNQNYFCHNGYSLVEFSPKTGRTHQIRIHAKYIGHPVVADEFYAGRKTAKSDRKWCPRLFLHAGRIKFQHPVTGKILEFESGLPSDLEVTLEKLRTG